MILNLTQHPATPEQLAAGVVDITGPARTKLIELLVFRSAPSRSELGHRATLLAKLASSEVANRLDKDSNAMAYGTQVMIGGASYLMPPLQARLLDLGLFAIYSFTERVSEEEMIGDTVVKTSKFKHVAFVDPYGQHTA